MFGGKRDEIASILARPKEEKVEPDLICCFVSWSLLF
jgi:hypothetical protein